MQYEAIEVPTDVKEALAEIRPAAPATETRRSRLPLLAAGAALIAASAGAWAYTSGDVQWSVAPQPAAVAAKPAEAAKPALAVVGAALPGAAPAAATVDPSSIIRGVIQSQSEAVIASRMTAGIIAMPYKTGQKFPKGALLASFDCSTIRAQLSAAQAATAAYKKSYDTNVELDAFKAVGRNEVGISKANLGKATAEANAVASQLTGCAVYAPFSGIVVEQIAHAHEVAATGQPLMKIQDAGNLEVQIIVPSNWLTWLKPGAKFEFKVDETGTVLKGSIARLGASVDPVSKTIRVIGQLWGAGGIVLPGMSGSAAFEQAGGNGKPAGA
jgi:membrane fusion protein, multidrug efflux system